MFSDRFVDATLYRGCERKSQILGGKLTLLTLTLKLRERHRQCVKRVETPRQRLFEIFMQKFPGLSCEQIKVDVFNRPESRELLQGEQPLKITSGVEREAWEASAAVVPNFLGDRKTSKNEFMQTVQSSLQELGNNME